MVDCRFVAFHGWGFSDFFWEPWADRLSEFGTFESYDRGYFNDPKEVQTLAGPVSTILISHSFGLHLIEEPLFANADLLIILNGFLYFHPYAAQYKRRSRLILQEMINEFEIHPEEVLHKFYKNFFAPEPATDIVIENINHQLLLNDLRKLHDSELDAGLLKKTGKVCILHGADDSIVNKTKGRQIYTQLNYDAQYFEIRDAGHALPFTHHRRCLEFVVPEIETLVETTT
jgi:hypothetical protein